VADLSKLEKDAFWLVLDNRSWMHPFDDQGRRRDYADIPKAVSDLVDDPFRSLAGELRRAGGYAKDTTPFSEFLWADFLRRRIKRQDVEKDFDGALEEALKLAKGTDSITIGYPIDMCPLQAADIVAYEIKCEERQEMRPSRYPMERLHQLGCTFRLSSAVESQSRR
jgi:hypothetical protein